MSRTLWSAWLRPIYDTTVSTITTDHTLVRPQKNVQKNMWARKLPTWAATPIIMIS